MLVKKELILIAIESAYNTDPTPTGTDAILVEDVDFNFEGSRMIERNPVKPTLGKEKQIFGGKLAQISFNAELKGSGAAGTPPEIAAALRACGLAETIVASTSVTYEPASDSHESATIYYYQDGKLHKITGARGNAEFTFTVGDKPMVNFTFTGHHAEESDAALISGTFDSTSPVPLINIPFTVGAFNAAISAMTFSLNNEIATPVSISAVDGYGEIRITDRDCAGSFDPEATLIATQDWRGDWEAGNEKGITIGPIGSAAGNNIDMSIPNAAYRDLSQGDRDAVRTYDIPFGAVGDDNAFSLIYT